MLMISPQTPVLTKTVYGNNFAANVVAYLMVSLGHSVYAEPLGDDKWRISINKEEGHLLIDALKDMRRMMGIPVDVELRPRPDKIEVNLYLDADSPSDADIKVDETLEVAALGTDYQVAILSAYGLGAREARLGFTTNLDAAHWPDVANWYEYGRMDYMVGVTQ